MSTAPAINSKLHLPDLTISGFRGIEELSISRLGRVTLIAGKNGVGKTTVLDAVRIYAARGHYFALANILGGREELTDTIDGDGDETLAPNWLALFYGREISSDACISIGPGNKTQHLSIKTVLLSEKEMMEWGRRFFPEYSLAEDVRAIEIKFQDKQEVIPVFFRGATYDTRREVNSRRRLFGSRNLPPEIHCESLGPSLPSNEHMARFWDTVALTEDEARAVQALRLIYGDRVQRVAMIGGDTVQRVTMIGDRRGRRAVVKVKGQPRPVPLHSLGDGAVRLFGVALALANSRDGFLVIDEVENGIHHSIQRDFWRMVLETAHENNVQVLATTHSWDCVAGFARAAADLDETEGALVRLYRKNDQIRAIEYSKKNLKAAADYGIEVR